MVMCATEKNVDSNIIWIFWWIEEVTWGKWKGLVSCTCTAKCLRRAGESNIGLGFREQIPPFGLHHDVGHSSFCFQCTPVCLSVTLCKIPPNHNWLAKLKRRQRRPDEVMSELGMDPILCGGWLKQFLLGRSTFSWSQFVMQRGPVNNSSWILKETSTGNSFLSPRIYSELSTGEKLGVVWSCHLPWAGRRQALAGHFQEADRGTTSQNSESPVSSSCTVYTAILATEITKRKTIVN